MNEFYRQRKKWIFNELRRELPAYVEYRNQVRGHYALQGKPSSTRLQEQGFFALPSLLDRLDSYAWCERGQKCMGEPGRVRLYGRAVYINPRLNGQKIEIYETLEGLEAGRFYLLRNYSKELCRPLWSVEDKTRPYYFTRIYNSRCAELQRVASKTEVAMKEIKDCLLAAQESPRLAVAYSQ